MIKRTALLSILAVGFSGLGLTPALAVDERFIDIVSVSWAGSIPLPADVTQLAETVNTEVNMNWKINTVLIGDSKDRSISFVVGKTLLNPIVLNSKMACIGSASIEFMNSVRVEAYKRLGIEDYSQRYLIIASPQAGCFWSGRAKVGGPQSKSGVIVLHDTDSGFVISHELGHTFGLGHTNFLRCNFSSNDGPWGNTCKAVEYGGSIDIMGNVDTASPLNTYHQWRMGLLDDGQVKQVWKSEVLTLAPSDFANGLRAIYMRDGKVAYWIEYRRQLDGVGYKPGLVIFRIDPPPISSIVSPNPEDSVGEEFGQGLSRDVWMLNLDTFRYTNSNLNGGSMTSLAATTYSGNISFGATASQTGAVVTIIRKADVTAPPVPALIPVSEWRYPGIEITKAGYEDADTIIASYQASVDGVITDLPVTQSDSWSPTYLNPLTAPNTVHVRDLPEGSYLFALRAVDIAGNKSDWSAATKVSIDRSRPVATSDFRVTAVNAENISVGWTGAKDSGTGLCQTNLINEEGLVLQSSNAKTAPVIKLISGVALKATAQIFDCIGNGITGDLSLTPTLVPATQSSRTGKWSAAGSAYGVGALTCTGKCTASFRVKDRFDVLVGVGASTLSVSDKILATINDSKVAKLRIGATVDVGAVKKIVRVSGKNFVLISLASVAATFTNVKDLDRLPAIVDLSLTDTKQVELSKFGFNANDFSQEWMLLPMGGGTTLDDPSLDLCGAQYPSEKLRLERRQVIANKIGSAYTFLSTETVKYASVAAAVGAQKELVKAMAACQINKGFNNAAGAITPYVFTEIKNLPKGLVDEDSRLLVRAQIDSGVRARQLLGFYQFNGDMFTGLYVMIAGETGFTDAQVANWLKVAVTLASRLNGNNV